MNVLANLMRAFVSVILLTNTVYAAVEVAAQENVRDGKEPEPDSAGVISRKIIHRVAPTSVSRISPFGPTPRSGSQNYTIPQGATTSNPYPIQYHGGPIMSAVSNVVIIWYGNWNQNNNTDTPAGQQIIRNAIYGLANDTFTLAAGSSDYSGVTTASNSLISGAMSYNQSPAKGYVTQISSSFKECTQATSTNYGGTKLSDSYVQKLVKNTISLSCSGGVDTNAIYLVLSSSDISETSGFLTKYCGWHTYTTMRLNNISVPIKYGFIGNPAKSISSCTYQTTSSPNNNPGVDAMVSVIAHELEETVSDPQLNAWYNSQGAENGDMCAWTFGSSLSVASANNGSYYNVKLPLPNNFIVPGNYAGQYLIQRALSASNSACYVNANPVVQ